MADDLDIRIDTQSFRDLAQRLNLSPAEFLRAMRNSSNRTARTARRELVVQIQQLTGIKRKILNANIRVLTMRGKWRSARVAPSSEGIPISDYRYSFQPINNSKIRARILVDWVSGGKKVAAGFVNPLGQQRAPLRTRSAKGKLARPEPAIGPSVAAMFPYLLDSTFVNHISDVLQANFAEDLGKQGARRAARAAGQ